MLYALLGISIRKCVQFAVYSGRRVAKERAVRASYLVNKERERRRSPRKPLVELCSIKYPPPMLQRAPTVVSHRAAFFVLFLFSAVPSTSVLQRFRAQTIFTRIILHVSNRVPTVLSKRSRRAAPAALLGALLRFLFPTCALNP